MPALSWKQAMSHVWLWELLAGQSPAGVAQRRHRSSAEVVSATCPLWQPARGKGKENGREGSLPWNREPKFMWVLQWFCLISLYWSGTFCFSTIVVLQQLQSLQHLKKGRAHTAFPKATVNITVWTFFWSILVLTTFWYPMLPCIAFIHIECITVVPPHTWRDEGMGIQC